jgi:glycogen(starch) synthase
MGRNFNDIAEDLANMMFDFVKKSRRERIALRYKCEESSLHFDWSNLGKYYDEAYREVIKH